MDAKIQKAVDLLKIDPERHGEASYWIWVAVNKAQMVPGRSQHLDYSKVVETASLLKKQLSELTPGDQQRIQRFANHRGVVNSAPWPENVQFQRFRAIDWDQALQAAIEVMTLFDEMTQGDGPGRSPNDPKKRLVGEACLIALWCGKTWGVTHEGPLEKFIDAILACYGDEGGAYEQMRVGAPWAKEIYALLTRLETPGLDDAARENINSELIELRWSDLYNPCLHKDSN